MKKDILILSKLIEENKPRKFEIKPKDILLQVKELLNNNKTQFNEELRTLHAILDEIKYK